MGHDILLKHLSYDPCVSSERYPWKMRDPSSPPGLRSKNFRAVGINESPKTVHDFDLSWQQFKNNNGDPFQQKLPNDFVPAKISSKFQRKLIRRNSSRKNLVKTVPTFFSERKLETFTDVKTIYSPKVEDASPMTPPRTLEPHSTVLPSTPQKRSKGESESSFDELSDALHFLSLGSDFPSPQRPLSPQTNKRQRVAQQSQHKDSLTKLQPTALPELKLAKPRNDSPKGLQQTQTNFPPTDLQPTLPRDSLSDIQPAPSSETLPTVSDPSERSPYQVVIPLIKTSRLVNPMCCGQSDLDDSSSTEDMISMVNSSDESSCCTSHTATPIDRFTEKRPFRGRCFFNVMSFCQEFLQEPQESFDDLDCSTYSSMVTNRSKKRVTFDNNGPTVFGQTPAIALQQKSTVPTRIKLRIDDYDKTEFRRILKELRRNRQLRELDVFRARTAAERTRSIHELQSLFSIVGSFTTLQRLYFQDFEPKELELLPLEDLLDSNPLLTSLEIGTALSEF